jgi:hypothetical protein
MGIVTLIRRSAFGGRRSAVGIRRSAFGVGVRGLTNIEIAIVR